VIVDGEPNASDDPAKDPARECFAPALRFRLGPSGTADGERVEPLAADARPQGDGRDNALLKIIAGVLGVGYDSLKQREIGAARRRARLAQAIAASMALLAVAAAAGGLVAWRQRKAALLEQSRALAVMSARASSEGKQATAMLVALEALPTPGFGGYRPLATEAAASLYQAWLRDRETLTLVGHTGKVRSAAFSLDGSRVVTASDDGTARVWTLTGGRPTSIVLSVSPPPPQPVLDRSAAHAEYSPDGQHVLVVTNDFAARLWDLRGEKPNFVRLVARGSISFASFSSDSKHVVTITGRTAQLWDVSGDQPTFVILKGHAAELTSVAFSGDGKRVVTASEDMTARVWDIGDDLTRPTVLAIPADAVDPNTLTPTYMTAASFSRDGNRVLVGCWAGVTRVWDLSADPPASSELKGSCTETASFSPDGKSVVTVEYGQNVKIWDISNLHEPTATVLTGSTANVTAAAFSADGQFVVTGSEDGTVRVWEKPHSKYAQYIELTGHIGRINAVSFSPDGKQVVSASDDGTAAVWALQDDISKVLPIPNASGLGEVAAISPDGHKVVTTIDQDSAYQSTAQLCDVSVSPPQCTLLNGSTGDITSATFSLDGERLVTVSDRTARVWSLTAGQPTSIILEGHTKTVNSAAFSPDGSQVVTASDDETVRVWTPWASTPPSFVTLDMNHEMATIGRFSRDGRRLVTGTSEGTLRMWEMFGGTPRFTELKPTAGVIDDAAFSPDGRRLVAASGYSARVYEVAGDTGRSIALDGHTDLVTHVAFSHDGRQVLTASDDATARVWDISGDRPTFIVLDGHKAALTAAAFGASDRHVLTASQDGTARIWDISDGHPSSVVLDVQARQWRYPDVRERRQLRAAVLSDDEQRVLTVGETGAQVWRYIPDTDDLIRMVLKELAVCLSQRQRASFGLPSQLTDDQTVIRAPDPIGRCSRQTSR